MNTALFHHGRERADRYYNGLINRFEELAENPRLWQAVDHIAPDIVGAYTGVIRFITGLPRMKP
jgi:hypothetical protein